MIRIAVLTSSRADYGIYFPLLKKMNADSFFDVRLIAFGTHLSKKFGNTIEQVKSDGFKIEAQLNTIFEGDSPEDIADSMAKTLSEFSALWKKSAKNFDWVLCLGDRYEMFAAVASTIPFNLKVAHLHGGETTLGAIDNKFRHSITAMSSLHFVSHKMYAERVKEITGSSENIHTVGALGLDNLKEIPLFSVDEFKKKYGVDLSKPTVLVTFHPETVSWENNVQHTEELLAALGKLKEQIVITMPNADTMGNHIRTQLKKFIKANPTRAFGFDSLGTQGYFSCMKHCSFLLGNTSSGIIEAASFAKYVINTGDRQKGRLTGKNVIHVPVENEKILAAVQKISSLAPLDSSNIYGDGNAAEKIISIFKEISH